MEQRHWLQSRLKASSTDHTMHVLRHGTGEERVSCSYPRPEDVEVDGRTRTEQRVLAAMREQMAAVR